MTQAPESKSQPAAQHLGVTARLETASVEELRRRWFGGDTVAAGQLVESLLLAHGPRSLDAYVEEGIDNLARAGGGLSSLGPVLTVEEHLDTVHSRWHAQRVPVLTGRHVILGLALDPGVGWPVLQDGVIGSLLSRWTPGQGTEEEPHRLAWDLLSDAGLGLAEEQPLLAAAFGAPAETTVALPAAVRAMAWAPGGDRIAALAGDRVYEVRLETGTTHLLGRVGEAIVGLGWGAEGVVALSIQDGQAELVQVSDGTPLGDWTGVTAGVLSGDGSHAWLQTSDGVLRWAPGSTAPMRLTSPQQTEPAIPSAVDRSGHHGLLRLGKYSVLVVALPPGSLPGPSSGRGVFWPSDAAPILGWGPPRSSPCALVTLGRRIATAYAAPVGVDIWHVRGIVAPDAVGPDAPEALIPVCRLATGSQEAGVLAADATGTRLAVGVGAKVSVWSLGQQRPSAAPVPAYDTDRPDVSGDLLDAGRDAQAIAALVSARDVQPPLSIGLFGAWGSGKSFILEQVIALLKDSHRPEGYVRHLRVVRFNAWQYAESNLWASLVDQVLQEIAPFRAPDVPPEVTEATSRAESAAAAERAAAEEVEAAKKELDAARLRLTTRRRTAALLWAAVLLVAAAAVAAVLLGYADRVVAAWTVVVALVTAAAGVAAQARKAGEQAGDIAEAGRSGIAAVGRLVGRPEEMAVHAKAAELQRLETTYAATQARAAELKVERDQVVELAQEQPLGALLHRLSTINEFRDQLSLVTRTRDHFQAVDAAISAARRRADEARLRLPSGAGAESVPEPTAAAGATTDGMGAGALPDVASEIERIVIVIDDLDRCPPEKVVKVLEAVHLLFSFEMFVVLIAVDTRWLEQSLKIQYRRLLGGSASAAPTDYLEKIIQVPLHLLPLDESKVRTMIAGLAKAAPESEGTGTGAEAQNKADDHRGDAGVSGDRAGAPQEAATPRAAPRPLPAEVMQVTPDEAAAMSAVAPLVGTTPRTVKRFVNTYRLLKARAYEPGSFDQADDGEGDLGDHEVVAFLLAVVTGQPGVARSVLAALLTAPRGMTAEHVVSGVQPGTPGTGSPELAAVQSWLATQRPYADAPTQRYVAWAREVARFSFVPPVL